MLMDETGEVIVFFVECRVREVWQDEGQRRPLVPVFENKGHLADERRMLFRQL